MKQRQLIKEAVSKARNSEVNKALMPELIQLYQDHGNLESVLTHIILPATRAMTRQSGKSKSKRMRGNIDQSTDKSTDNSAKVMKQIMRNNQS